MFLSKVKYNFRNILRVNPLKKSRIWLRMAEASHRKGLVLRVVIITPKKPNSAIRHVAKLSLYKNGRRAFGRIPGIGSAPATYNRVLVRGGRANDLPTVRLTLVRGVYDFAGLFHKKRKRSKYGTARKEGTFTHIRRRYRNIYQ